ncbi:3-dehydroquinate synthase [Croceimicrobium sp.]|uniref:3-dehydroquinate synthase n=1 Tax=Croceimicrobium sp. TaxID=2828340 RepID=UPI003BAAFD08
MIDQLEKFGLFFEEKALLQFQSLMLEKDYSKIAILCDSHTHDLCLPIFLSQLPTLEAGKLEIVELEPGEETKSIEVLAQVWDAFGALEMDRHSVLINLGGGVISDLGGFAAATYMRGIDFINFPTSLLAMVDASVGAKTGINFGAYKNRIGLFTEPLMVGILPEFLETLPEEEFLSGWAEMLKHGLIADAEHYRGLIRRKPNTSQIDSALIAHSVAIKAEVVAQDKHEGGLRKILNFGHSIGHALESWYQQAGQPLTHGYAVALGMQVELSLSAAFAECDINEVQALQRDLRKFYPVPVLKPQATDLKTMLLGDKKNKGSHLRFSLLRSCGAALYDIEVPMDSVLEHYNNYFHG